MKKGLASVVILTWNTPDEVRGCFKSLTKQTYKNFEVILVDNGSKKENVAALKKIVRETKDLKIKTIFNKENLGFCEGNNVGVRIANGEYVIFLSDDTIVDRNWLKFMIEPFQKDKKVGGTCSKVIFDGNKTIQCAGGELMFYGKIVSLGLSQKDRKEFNVSKNVLWGQGCSLAFRKNVLDELEEYFCPQFFIYFDDVDLSWRVNGLGYKIVYEPRSFLYHKGSVAVEKNAEPGKFIRNDQLYRNLRNKYLSFWRNLKIYHLPIVMPFVFGYDIGKSAYFLARGSTDFYGSRFNYALGTLRALSGFLRLVSKVGKPRRARLSDLMWSM